MAYGKKVYRLVGVFLVLLFLMAVFISHVSMQRSLIVYLEDLSLGMTLKTVQSSVPSRFFKEEGIATNSYYLLDRVFQDNVLAYRFLAYSQIKGERFADAQIFFDQNNVLIGFSYAADGFYQLSPTRTDGGGPGGSRTRVSGIRTVSRP
ncbi:MAG: hypothetical protein PHY48_15460 [Candidatus Cloacimonetes bacterium]|nr:hypothetical protein [Candidatus Cloacimonadota bacterium]